jgi:3-hydroxyacyl-[acyl-carrier-protein] dehydratase
METLLKNFYTLKSKSVHENKLECIIELNPDHEVYSGHFPQIPIAPGVCLTQIIKEVCEAHLGKKIRMTQGRNIKFLALINPREKKDFILKIEIKPSESDIDCDASFIADDKAYMKFKGNFK